MLSVVYIKMVGAVIWMIAGVVLSFEINKFGARRLSQAEAFIELIKSVRLKIECYSMPIPEILKSLDTRLVAECGGELADRSSLKNFYETSNVILDGNGKRLLAEFCSCVGRGYKNNEIKLCDSCIDRLEEYKTELAKGLPRFKRTSTTVCACIFGSLLLLVI